MKPTETLTAETYRTRLAALRSNLTAAETRLDAVRCDLELGKCDEAAVTAARADVDTAKDRIAGLNALARRMVAEQEQAAAVAEAADRQKTYELVRDSLTRRADGFKRVEAVFRGVVADAMRDIREAEKSLWQAARSLPDDFQRLIANDIRREDSSMEYRLLGALLYEAGFPPVRISNEAGFRGNASPSECVASQHRYILDRLPALSKAPEREREDA